MQRVLSSDPLSRTVRNFHCEEPGQYVVETLQDVTDIVELNKAEYNAHSHKSRQKFKGEKFHRIARIPLSKLFEPGTGRMYDDKELLKWLASDDAKAWQTMPGRFI